MMLKTRNFKKQNNIFVFQKRLNEKESSLSVSFPVFPFCFTLLLFANQLKASVVRWQVRGPGEGQERCPPVGGGKPIVNSTTRSAPRVKAFSKWIFNCVSVLKKLAVMLNFSKSS